MNRLCASLLATLLSLVPLTSRASEPLPPADESAPPPVVYHPNGDLFPKPLRPSVSAATGLPFLGIGEIGMGVTNGFAIGVVGGITPSVLTAGIRPRFRVRTSEHVAMMLSMPMLWYPKASAPGPGNIGNSTWVLTRPELMLDGTISARHVRRVSPGYREWLSDRPLARGDQKLSRFLLDPSKDGDEAARRTQWMQLVLARASTTDRS